MTDTSSIHLETESLLVGITTWNVGNAQPLLAELPELLGDVGNVDILVLGGQEAHYKVIDDAHLVETLKKKYGEHFHEEEVHEDHGGGETSSTNSVHHHVHFYDIISAYCCNRGFKEVKTHSLGEMRLIVMAKERHIPRITHVETSHAACGIGHLLANKGGIIIKLAYQRHTLAFVASHLAAHLKDWERRNSDFVEIVTEASVGNPHLNVLNEFDYVFWMGDLNYRIDLWTAVGKAQPKEKGETHEQHWAEVKDLADKKQWVALMQGDQLKREQAKGEIFQGFHEPDYNFLPTFKVKRWTGTTHLAQRSPAYCDRILWRMQPYLEKYRPVTVREFVAVENVSTSDHKPVRGRFDVKLLAKPNFHQINADRRVARITLTGVKGTSLVASDVTGSSDPYLAFNMMPEGALVLPKGQSYLHTRRKTTQTLDPVFEDHDVPTVLTRCTTLKELKETCLILSFWDYDPVQPDDPLGDAIVCFESVMERVGIDASDNETAGFAFHINEALNLCGKKLEKSKLSATVTVDWVEQREAQQGAGAVESGGCCAIV